MTDEHITAYLLEELTERESEQFEEECFTQEEWPAELDAAEHDLIDAYLRNELTSNRKRHFEERYLTADARKARVLTAKSLHESLDPPQPKLAWSEWLKSFLQRPLVPQAVLAILVLAIGIGLIGPRLLGPRPPQSFTEIELARSSSDRATGDHPTIVSLPLGTDALRIHLKLSEPSADTAGYRVQWQNVKSNTRDLKIESQDAQSVVVNILGAELIPGKYILRLSNKDGVIDNYMVIVEEAARTR